MMLWIYRAAFLPVFLVLFPRHLLRMLRRGGYARDFAHRLGAIAPLPPKPVGKQRVWLQAVSVGEVNALVPLLKMLAADATCESVLTTTTSTGYAIAREKSAAFTCATGIFPIDFWPFSHRAWRRIRPDLAVLMESELWPEHLAQARRHRVPIVLINARLSDRSFRRYARCPRIARQQLDTLAHIGAATRADMRRFKRLGVPAEKITLTGNLKFDAVTPSCGNPARDGGAELRRSLGFGDAPGAPVLLGSSTWPGEEEMLLETLRQARKRGIPLRLLIVPRHAERRGEITAMLAHTPWSWFLRTQHPAGPPHPADVCVADTTGELGRITSQATLAFIGKSLPPNNGGQTPIECAAQGVPMVYGPHMSNFREICGGLEKARAALRVPDATAATNALLMLADNAPRRDELARKARQWHTANQGATQRTLALLNRFREAAAPPAHAPAAP
ncbi:MAG: hypothetical protein LBD14_05430 [Puniceicoccales bacterium]|jgi:3-deoxy-D-manno-octulosonic-acid transferase|nr:hypothetical protein [Puniceicoccales bacterium]